MVAILTVVARRPRRPLGREPAREPATASSSAAELFVELGARMEDGARPAASAPSTLADLAVPILGDVAMVDMLDPGGHDRAPRLEQRPLRTSPRSSTSSAQKTPIAPDGPHPVAEVIRTGEPQELDQLTDEQIDEITTTEDERELLRRHRFQSCLVLPLARPRLGARRPDALDHADRPRVRRDREADRAAASRSGRRSRSTTHGCTSSSRHIAGVLQHSLLPRSLPEIPGFEVSSRFEAAGAGLRGRRRLLRRLPHRVAAAGAS